MSGLETLPNSLKTLINGIHHFSEDEMMFISKAFERKEINRNDMLVSPGKLCRYHYFIEKGVSRNLIAATTDEVTTYIAHSGSIVSCFSNFIDQRPDQEGLEMLSEGIVWRISYHQMHELYNSIPKWERIGRVLAETNYQCLIDRTHYWKYANATERYMEYLEKTDREVLEVVPLQYIASYLGIRPESLSRIRKSIT